MTFDPRNDMDKLNSATKYPSILTYHGLDPKTGKLLENQPTTFPGMVIGTEKIDGTNGRIILLPDGDWFIGSREELLYAKGDRIRTPNLSIVPTLAPIAEGLTPSAEIATYFFEVYGGGVGAAWKSYTTDKAQTGARLFDIHVMSEEVYTDVLSRPQGHISTWRQNGGQSFLSFLRMGLVAESEGLETVPHKFTTVPGTALPTTLVGMRDFILQYSQYSSAVLDGETVGRSEGLILRSADRSTIAKARIQDYDRTLRRMGQS